MKKLAVLIIGLILLTTIASYAKCPGCGDGDQPIVRLGIHGFSIPCALPDELDKLTLCRGLIAPIAWRKLAGQDGRGLYFGDIGICQFYVFCSEYEDCSVILIRMQAIEDDFIVFKWWRHMRCKCGSLKVFPVEQLYAEDTITFFKKKS